MQTIRYSEWTSPPLAITALSLSHLLSHIQSHPSSDYAGSVV